MRSKEKIAQKNFDWLIDSFQRKFNYIIIVKKNERTNSSFVFLPKNLKNRLKTRAEIGDEKNWVCGEYPIAFWFNFGTLKKNYLMFGIQVGYSTSLEKNQFLDFLNNNNWQYLENGQKREMNIKTLATTIYNRFDKFNDWNDKDKIFKLMVRYYEIAEKYITQLIEIVGRYDGQMKK